MLDETENTQDNTSGEGQETSGKEPESFTKEQVEERERKAKSDVSAELGRLKVTNASLIKSSQAIQDRLARKDKEEDERAREEYKDLPDKLSAIAERAKRRESDSELVQVKQELDEEKAKTLEAEEISVKSTKERNAREIATRLGVKAETLMKFADSIEAMEELADSLPKKESSTLTVDSGKTTGGSKGIPTDMTKFRTWIKDMSQEEYEKRAPEINQMMKGGKIK